LERGEHGIHTYDDPISSRTPVQAGSGRCLITCRDPNLHLPVVSCDKNGKCVSMVVSFPVDAGRLASGSRSMMGLVAVASLNMGGWADLVKFVDDLFGRTSIQAGCTPRRA
jgi:hypothetical protein